MAIGDVWSITNSALFLGQVNQNSMAFRLKSAATVDVPLLLTVANDMKELFRPVQAAGYVYTTFKAVEQRGGTATWPDGDCKKVGGLGYEANLTGSLAGGGISGTPLPPQCAMVTTLRSDFVGRTHRGRVYQGGLDEADQSSGAWMAAVVTAQEARWTTFKNKYMTPSSSDPNFELGVWSFRTATGCKYAPNGDLIHDQPASPSTAFTFVTATLVRSAVYTQRRRVIGRGM